MRNCFGRGAQCGPRGFGSRRGSGGGQGGGFRDSFQTPRSERGGLYRSRNGKLLGVCQGIAEYLDVRASRIRIITVLAVIFTGVWPVGILYLVAAAIMKPEPMVPFESRDEQEFYDSYAGSRTGALSRLKGRFDTLDRRLRRMEDVVTSTDFQWEQKLRS
ncbi:MAG: envelope stress response membrane protein PspC [Proteobacteria bacterium]|nr:envelope stress response membrane protein PspC [Pseudomonadota bacterium]